ncbi:MAG: hypothetical protein CBE00_12065 [Planctomycetaceae bacterium TMED240]|nr:hypothetical protein [Rhodopirellula sp.]OUX04578.1 MAG: hypothetical protein CBE00_12065 [Planctomycetaceae bacterium TMED240]
MPRIIPAGVAVKPFSGWAILLSGYHSHAEGCDQFSWIINPSPAASFWKVPEPAKAEITDWASETFISALL